MGKFLKLLRVEQWVKNFFVFTPLFFSGNVTHVDLMLKSIFAFLVFSFTASSIYVLNDYSDIESDKKHPEKCKRPLAVVLEIAPLAKGLLHFSGCFLSDSMSE